MQPEFCTGRNQVQVISATIIRHRTLGVAGAGYFCKNRRMDEINRPCWICIQPHWEKGKLMPGGRTRINHLKHTELELLLWRSLKRPPGRETESAFGSRPESGE